MHQNLSLCRSIKLNTIREHVNRDQQYIDLIETIENGFPNRKELTLEHLQPFWSLREELYTNKNIVYIAGKPLIPKSLRSQLLNELHLSHQGVSTMKSNARQQFYWPRMNNDINIRENSQRCNQTAPSLPKERPIPTEQPDFPFQKTVMDLFHMVGHLYLIYADRFSGWTEVASSNVSNAKAICSTLRSYFATFGVPTEISTDGGPPFN